MSQLVDLLLQLGFDIAWKKVTIPSTSVVYLGIELDSVVMEVRLPDRKVVRLKQLVSEFKEKSSCTLHELQVLCGHLAHASRVVRGGRTFSRRLINFTKYMSNMSRRVMVPDWLVDDLEWWSSFFSVYNGQCPIIKNISILELKVESDSSMTGFGARFGSNWFLGVWHLPFPPPGVPRHHYAVPPSEYESDLNINVLELWPIVEAAFRWGKSWKGYKVRVLTDNTQVLSMINTGRSSNVTCMHWLREIFWLSFIYDFHLVASHISTKENVLPDYLSRFCDPKRRAFIPSTLTRGLCCFRDGLVADPVEGASVSLDGRQYSID